jgi:hypothetical protein
MRLFTTFMLCVFFSHSAALSAMHDRSENVCKKFFELHQNDTAYIPGSQFDLTFDKSRKWFINGLNIIKNPSTFIPQRYKKRFSSKLKIQFGNTVCTLRARTRQNGDWKDHIEYTGFNITQSLDVHLTDGNLYGATKFKLFIPKTKNGRNHVLGSLVVRKAGFLSPQPMIIKINFNDQVIDYLLEPKIVKEFIEKNRFRESVILEGDEGLIWGYKNFKPLELEPLSLAKVANSKWASKSLNNSQLAAASLARVQNTYVQTKLIRDAATFIDWDGINSQSMITTRHGVRFDFLVMALGGTHALKLHNRKYYLDTFTNEIIPVLYDPNFDFKCCDGPTVLATKKDLELYSQKFEIEDFIYLDNLLNDIGKNQQKEEINQLLGSDDQNNWRDFQNMIARARVNLKILRTELETVRDRLAAPEKDAEQNWQDFFARLNQKLSSPQFVNVLNFIPQKKMATIERCSSNGCSTEQITLKQLSMILRMDLEATKSVKFFWSVKGDNVPLTLFDLPSESVKLLHTPSAKVEFDSDKRALRLIQRKPGDKFLFLNQGLKNLSVEFSGLDHALIGYPAVQKQSNWRSRLDHLTGCVTFYNTELVNVDFSAISGFCEDQINLVRSRGQLKNVKLTDAFSDAIDFDFSQISIANLMVDRAGNDCVDFSGGIYHISSAVLERCGDKGISIGEKSEVKLEHTYVSNSRTAVAVKDSSYADIENLQYQNVSTCLAVYNKKQEFNGASANLGKTKCLNEIMEVDDFSYVSSNP